MKNTRIILRKFWVFLILFQIAPRHLDECTKSKLLNLKQENMRPQRNIEINEKIPDEKYQNNKHDDKDSDDRDQIPTINKKK